MRFCYIIGQWFGIYTHNLRFYLLIDVWHTRRYCRLLIDGVRLVTCACDINIVMFFIITTSIPGLLVFCFEMAYPGIRDDFVGSRYRKIPTIL